MGILSKINALGASRIIRAALSIYKHGFTLLALLEAAKRQDTNTAYIEDDHGSVSYKNLYEESLALACQLNQHYGIGSKSKIAIVSTNSIDFVRSLFAVSGLGADIFLLNPKQKEEYFKTIFSKHKITMIIAESESSINFKHYGIPLYALNAKAAETLVKGNLTKAVYRKKGRLTILSSGSGGHPTTERRNVSPMQFLNPLTDIIIKLRLKADKSVLISVPVFHGYGLAALLLAIFLGKRIRLTKRFDSAKTLQLLSQEKSDCWIAVPIMIQRVLSEGDVTKINVRSIISGGDVLPSSVVKAIHRTTTVRLYNMYGTSETGVCIIASDEDLRKYADTLGKAITGVRTKIFDTNGNFATIGEAGTLSVKCGWSSDTRSKMFTATGDLVSANREGYYFFKGRQDDLMVIGGENVYPIEVENIIYKNPAIRWVKVRGITDNHAVTKIHVDLIINPETEFDQNHFLAWVSTQVPHYMVPKSVAILHELPVLKLM